MTTRSLKGPFRTEDQTGRQIVQVRFPGGNVKSYAYAVPTELGELAVGDFVWTEGNPYNPYGSPARITGLGSEYSGEFSVITCKLDPGYEPQQITVKRYRSPR